MKLFEGLARRGVWFGGHEHDLLIVLGDGQDVAVDLETPEVGVEHGLGAVAGGADRVRVPELAELGAARRQVGQQLDQAGVLRVAVG